ncbi:tyrosine-type recombinase/integrase [Chromobacterium haemolyticum]|uniref:Tyr recombinase domain-containing protein n=1 Tax=Chromobacterium haemolyticum TaxID=394935 RepID=A0A1W0CCI6_9NEIS|nr:tyrosine-type recombinase/integrase [Chromobacterium haemolyticum]OQS32473.1 hypothetical protein B0T45_21710 [Chromobacterium haemolyticum]
MKRYLKPDERQRLLNAAYRTNDPLAQRDYHLMSALYYSACRVGEFLQLTLSDAWAALKTGSLFIPAEYRKGRVYEKTNRAGKTVQVDTRQPAYVHLTQPLRMHLVALLNMNDCQQGDAPLVPGRFGEALTVRAVQLRVEHWAQEAGLGFKASPHWLRHSRAMDIFRTSTAKNPLQIVQSVLAHASLNSTAIYAGPSREEIEATLEALDGKAGRTTKAQLRRDYQQRRAG